MCHLGKPLKALFTGLRLLRASSLRKRFCISASTSVSRNLIVMHRNASRRGLRRGRVRRAAAEGARSGRSLLFTRVAFDKLSYGCGRRGRARPSRSTSRRPARRSRDSNQTDRLRPARMPAARRRWPSRSRASTARSKEAAAANVRNRNETPSQSIGPPSTRSCATLPARGGSP